MTKHTADFVYEKSTKNTHRYQEEPQEGKAPIIGSIYIQKWAVGSSPPQSVTVTVEA